MNTDQIQDGNTALILASERDKEEAVEILLEHGAKTDMQDQVC